MFIEPLAQLAEDVPHGLPEDVRDELRLDHVVHRREDVRQVVEVYEDRYLAGKPYALLPEELVHEPPEESPPSDALRKRYFLDDLLRQ
jgi:hypothetical protein